jgi:hypothetical protein
MSSRPVRRTLSVAVLTVAIGVVGLPTAQAGTQQIVTHKFFPLEPGTTFHYKSDDGKRTTVKVTEKTRVIQGHRSVRVDTKEIEGGSSTVSERFSDWYFQGSSGTVWYMKHNSSKPGESWEAGKDGAKKGTYIPADPQEGDVWKRTRAPNAGREGRDQATAYSVSSKNLKLKVKSYAGLYSETVKFYYKAGTGLVMIKDKGETTELKSVDKP